MLKAKAKKLFEDLKNQLDSIKIFIEDQPILTLQFLAFSSLFGVSLYLNSNIYNGVLEGKHFYFVFVALVFSSLAIVGNPLSKNKNQFSFTIIDIVILTYFLYSIIHVIFMNISVTRGNTFVEHMMMLQVYWFGKKLIEKLGIKQSLFLFLIFLVISFYHAFFGLLQIFDMQQGYHNYYNTTGFFFNPAPFGCFLAITSSVAFGLLFLKGSSRFERTVKSASMATMFLVLIVIPSTLSRASWIAAISGALFVSIRILDIPKYLKSYLTNKLLIGTASTLLVIVISLASYSLFYMKEGSSFGRLLTWKISYQIIQDNPFFGVGTGRFTKVFGDKQSEYFESGNYTHEEAMVAGKGEYAFNEFLQIGVEKGIVGILLFSILVFYAFKRLLYQKSKNYDLFCMLVSVGGGFVAILTFGLFSYPFSMTTLLFHFVFFLSFTSAYDPKKYVVRFPRYIYHLFKVGTLLICIWVVILQYQKYKAMEQWYNASLLKSYSYHDKAIPIFDEIKSRLSHRGDFMLDYGQTLAVTKDCEKAIPILMKASELTSDPYLYCSLGNCNKLEKKYDEAEMCYQHAHRLIPHKFYPRYLLVKLYVEIDEIEKAVKLANEIKAMEIKIESKAIDDMLSEIDRILDGY